MEREEFVNILSTHPIPDDLYKSFGEFLNAEVFGFAYADPLQIADLLTCDISTPEAPFYIEVIHNRDLVCYDPEDTAYHIGTLRRVEVCDYIVDRNQIDLYPQYYYICILDDDIVAC